MSRQAQRKAVTPKDEVRAPRLRAASVALRETAERIREARLRAGLTQEEAAGRAEIDYKRWQQLERGTANPTLLTLARVAHAVKARLSVTFD